jgi:hypothetical protein
MFGEARVVCFTWMRGRSYRSMKPDFPPRQLMVFVAKSRASRVPEQGPDIAIEEEPAKALQT